MKQRAGEKVKVPVLKRKPPKRESIKSGGVNRVERDDVLKATDWLQGD